MQTLKRLSPELAKLVAQRVYARHQAAARETEELRAVLAELIRRGRDPRELLRTLLTGETIGGAVDGL